MVPNSAYGFVPYHRPHTAPLQAVAVVASPPPLSFFIGSAPLRRFQLRSRLDGRGVVATLRHRWRWWMPFRFSSGHPPTPPSNCFSVSIGFVTLSRCPSSRHHSHRPSVRHRHPSPRLIGRGLRPLRFPCLLRACSLSLALLRLRLRRLRPCVAVGRVPYGRPPSLLLAPRRFAI